MSHVMDSAPGSGTGTTEITGDLHARRGTSTSPAISGQRMSGAATRPTGQLKENAVPGKVVMTEEISDAMIVMMIAVTSVAAETAMILSRDPGREGQASVTERVMIEDGIPPDLIFSAVPGSSVIIEMMTGGMTGGPGGVMTDAAFLREDLNGAPGNVGMIVKPDLLMTGVRGKVPGGGKEMNVRAAAPGRIVMTGATGVREDLNADPGGIKVINAGHVKIPAPVTGERGGVLPPSRKEK